MRRGRKSKDGVNQTLRRRFDPTRENGRANVGRLETPQFSIARSLLSSFFQPFQFALASSPTLQLWLPLTSLPIILSNRKKKFNLNFFSLRAPTEPVICKTPSRETRKKNRKTIRATATVAYEARVSCLRKVSLYREVAASGPRRPLPNCLPPPVIRLSCKSHFLPRKRRLKR